MAQNRAKFAYLSYDDMLQRITNGELDQHDAIFTKDSKETYIITPDLTPMPIKSRVYVFNSISEAEMAINANTDTYEGQIVSILEGNKYSGYVVNKNTMRRSNQYTVVPLSDTSNIDYDTLGNKPIVNLVGASDSPIIVSALSSGTYSIKGHYKVSDIDTTTYLNPNVNLFIVEQTDDSVLIKKISSNEIVDYEVVDNITTKTNQIVTEEYLKQKNFVTTTYVDEKIAALDFVKKDEVATYVDNLVKSILDAELDERIDKRIDEKIISVSDEQILSLFV